MTLYQEQYREFVESEIPEYNIKNMIDEENSLEQQIAMNEQKNRTAYLRIEGVIDRMIELYEQSEQNILNGKDPEKVISDLNEQLLTLKPLKTVRQHFVHYYRKLSALMRRLQNGNKNNNVSLSRYSRRRESNGQSKEQQNNQRFKKYFSSFIIDDNQKKALERMVVEHYLRQGDFQCANIWSSKVEELDQNNFFYECHKLKDKIKKGNFQEAISWCESQKLYESSFCFLEYELVKTLIVCLVQKGQAKEALEYYKNKISKYMSQNSQEIEKLIGFILFRSKIYWGEPLQEMSELQILTNHRYRLFTCCPQKCQWLAQNFQKQFLKHNKINQFNILKIVYDCSRKVSDQYRRLLYLTWQNQSKPEDVKKYDKQLPFSIPLSTQYQYHSLFLCPVTKEVHSSGDKSVVLSCGHMISQAAQDRINQELRGRRRVKCPICQKELQTDQNISVDF